MSVELRDTERGVKLGEYHVKGDDADYILRKLEELLHYKLRENVAGIINVQTEINLRIKEILD